MADLAKSEQVKKIYQDNTEEAIKKFRKALHINPDLFRVHDSLAILLAQRGDFSGAFSHYHQAVNLYPGFAKAHNNLGSALAQQSKFEEAMVHFEKAINIDPNYIDAKKNLELARLLFLEATRNRSLSR